MKRSLKTIGLYLMASVYILGGTNHFINPDFYLPMMPPYLPSPQLLNYLAGAAELILGVALLFPRRRSQAAWGVIALLAAVFPANLYMYQSGGAGYSVPHWALAARLPLQLVLMAWAYVYVKSGPAEGRGVKSPASQGPIDYK